MGKLAQTDTEYLRYVHLSQVAPDKARVIFQHVRDLKESGAPEKSIRDMISGSNLIERK